ncbi:MAG: hypothetical protein J6P44_00820 [Bacteroidales bacterium]|nr:hypothetical protein [Bacteroidales bacterium]
MTAEDMINAFKRLGDDIRNNIDGGEYQEVLTKAQKVNPWFDKTMTTVAIKNLTYITDSLTSEMYAKKYGNTSKNLYNPSENKQILVVCAGNVPAVAFHDIMCVLLSGCKVLIKLSSDDNVIIPFLLKRLTSFLPEAEPQIEYLKTHISDIKCGIDGVIATGSNSSSLIFEQYFGDIPHIIRRSRYSLAVITPEDDISGLEDDICLYYGLGCRSISHLLVPEGYDFSLLIQKLQKYSYISDSNKYRNNLDYQKAVMIMNNIGFIDAGAVLLRQNGELYSPVSVVNYSYYNNMEVVKKIIEREKDNLQCVTFSDRVDLNVNVASLCRYGDNQKPVFDDFADAVDTLKWACGIKKIK